MDRDTVLGVTRVSSPLCPSLYYIAQRPLSTCGSQVVNPLPGFWWELPQRPEGGAVEPLLGEVEHQD